MYPAQARDADAFVMRVIRRRKGAVKTDSMTATKPTAEAAMAAIVALVVALQKKGILSMNDFYDELSMIELSAAALNTASAQSLREGAGAARDLFRLAALHVDLGPPPEELRKELRAQAD